MPHGFGDVNDFTVILVWPIMAIVALSVAQIALTSLAFLLSLNLPGWLFESIFNVFGIFTFKIFHAIAIAGCIISGLIKKWMSGI